MLGLNTTHGLNVPADSPGVCIGVENARLEKKGETFFLLLEAGNEHIGHPTLVNITPHTLRAEIPDVKLVLEGECALGFAVASLPVVSLKVTCPAGVAGVAVPFSDNSFTFVPDFVLELAG